MLLNPPLPASLKSERKIRLPINYQYCYTTFNAYNTHNMIWLYTFKNIDNFHALHIAVLYPINTVMSCTY